TPEIKTRGAFTESRGTRGGSAGLADPLSRYGCVKRRHRCGGPRCRDHPPREWLRHFIDVTETDVRPIALEQEDRTTNSVELSRSSLLGPPARGVTPAVKTRTCPQHCGTRSARHRDRT